VTTRPGEKLGHVDEVQEERRVDYAGERVEKHLEKGRQWVLLFAGESDTPKCLNGCKTKKPQCARKLGHCSVVAAG